MDCTSILEKSRLLRLPETYFMSAAPGSSQARSRPCYDRSLRRRSSGSLCLQVWFRVAITFPVRHGLTSRPFGNRTTSGLRSGRCARISSKAEGDLPATRNGRGGLDRVREMRCPSVGARFLPPGWEARLYGRQGCLAATWCCPPPAWKNLDNPATGVSIVAHLTP